MARIYISYRSIDSHQKAIQQIYTRLAEKYETVTLSPQDQSLDTTVRQAQVQSHNVLLVIFGRYGLNMVDERGNRLIDDPYDAQHIEISAGLKHRMQIHTLVFDDMVEDLSEHIPEVLHGLTKQVVTLNMTNATVTETLDTLVDAIGDMRPRIPTSKPDLSKMVIQPSTKQASPPVMHLPQPVPSQQPSPAPEIYIHQSRNPVIRFFQRLGGQMVGQTTHPTQSEENNRPDTGRPRVESYRQMWPTSFLVIALVVGLAMFIASVIQTQAPDTSDEDFSLHQIATMERGAIDVAFSSDGTEVTHITPYHEVYYINWQTMDTPERLSVRMSSPVQVEYGMDDMLVMRNDSRIFVVNPREYNGYLAHQYVVETDATILDMAVSRTSSVIVFVLDTGEVVKWDYDEGNINKSNVVNNTTKLANIILSEDAQVIATLIANHLYILDGKTLTYIDEFGRFTFIAIDNNDSILLGLQPVRHNNRIGTQRYERGNQIFSLDDWTSKQLVMSNQHFLDYTSFDNYTYFAGSSLLIQQHENEIRIWQIKETGRYLGAYEVFEDFNDMNGIIQSIAISPDGQYLATATTTDTIIWELDVAD